MISLTTVLIISLVVSVLFSAYCVVSDSYGYYGIDDVADFAIYTVGTFFVVGGLSALLWFQFFVIFNS